MTARAVTGFYACFPRPEIGQTSLHFRAAFLTELHRKPGEKGKVHWRKFKQSSGEGAPQLQISVSCRGTRPDCSKHLLLRHKKRVNNLTKLLFTWRNKNECGFFAGSSKLPAYSGAFALTILAFLLTIGALCLQF